METAIFIYFVAVAFLVGATAVLWVIALRSAWRDTDPSNKARPGNAHVALFTKVRFLAR